MRTQVLALGALAITNVYARPSLSKREEKVWDQNGNIKLTFATETVKLGDVSIDDMFAKLSEACHETGLCETNGITFDGWWMAPGLGGDMGPITVTMEPSGSYPTWIRNGLVDTLKAAVVAAAKCGEVTNTQTCQGGDKGCQPVKSKAFQCDVPKYWGINYQAPNAGDSAPPFIGADVAMAPADSAACADAMTAIGAVAGAVNGAAGGVFTLLSLACS